MRRLLLAVAVVGSSLIAFAGPAVSQDSFGSVISICRQVALEEVAADGDGHRLEGQCVGATGLYLSAISRTLPEDEFNSSIADLVVALAELLLTPECVLESEIVEATLLARSQSTDPFQQEQLLLIANTLNACDFAITAAISAGNRNAPFGTDDRPRGNSASPN